MSIELRFVKHFAGQSGSEFSLDVEQTLPGAGVTALFGHSGSGKTTLLRCIAGLEQPECEMLVIDGQAWHGLPAHRRNIGYVFQEASLFPHLSAHGNLHYAIKRGRNPIDATQFERVVELLGIGKLLQRYPDQLSGGERQRVAIARALLKSPRLLLMDEPLASLDQRRKQEVLPYLENLHEQLEIPIVYVSHSIDEVARLADHVLIMEDGRVSASGDVTEVFARTDLPLHVGDETGVILHGTVAERDEQWHLKRVTFDGGDLWLRDAGDAVGKAVRVRVLARDVSLALSIDDQSSILNRLPVTVSELADDEDEAMLLIRLAAGPSPLLARLTRRSAEHLGLAVGMKVWAQIKSAAMVR